MKKIIEKPPFLIITFLILTLQSNAQFTINSQIRNRAELRNGYKNLSSEGSVPAIFITQRTRINFSYKSDILKIDITPQDVRIWGDEQLESSTGVYGDDASLTLFEGFATIKIKNNSWLAVGRQQLIYDNQRLLAARNWNQNGLAYDAAVLKFTFGSWNLHLGSSWNTISESSNKNFYPSNRFKSISFLWTNHEFNNNLNVSFLHLSNGVTETDSTNSLNFRNTTGLYTQYKKGNLNFWSNVYYQYGQNQSGTKISSLLVDADVSYKFENFTTGLGFGYLSGNVKTGTEQTTDHLFDVLYGARHKYFGSIDYFKSFASHTNQGGLADYYFYLNYNFSKTLSVCNIGHYFQLAQTNADTPDQKNLGYENDLILKYKFNNWGSFENGFAFFLPTESLKTIQEVKSNQFSHFLYVQLTITPTLLKQ